MLDSRETRRVVFGVLMGLAIGLSLGIALQNAFLGLAVGAGVGIIFASRGVPTKGENEDGRGRQ